MATVSTEKLEFDGKIPVLKGDNGKTLRMGLDAGQPQFYIVPPGGKGSSGEWFMRIHPDKIPNGMQDGDYMGGYNGTPRILSLHQQADGMTKVMIHPPHSTSGRFVIVRTELLQEAWAYTLNWFNESPRK